MFRHPAIFRALAALLALGGIGWGVLLALHFPQSDKLAFALMFGPGYVVTLGYCWRALAPPDTPWRWIIWGGSALVQGAWLFLPIADAFKHGPSALVNPATAWWACAFAISIYALFTDTADRWSWESEDGDDKEPGSRTIDR